MSFPAFVTREDLQALATLDLLPLRQTVGPARGTTLAFGRQGLLDGVSRPDRFRILRHGTGGQILARNGLALAEAQLVLRQAYGAAIEFGPPAAHTVIDPTAGTVLVPVMVLRIDAPRAFRRALQQMLAQRSAPCAQIHFQRHRVVLRAELPLACLIGVERQVLDSTDGSAQVQCSLLRYGPAPGRTADAIGGWSP